MKKLIILIFVYMSQITAQQNPWQQFTTSNSVNAMAKGMGKLWVATEGGLYWCGTDYQFEVINNLNSTLPVNVFHDIAIDNSSNTIWLTANGYGIIKYQNGECQFYNSSNSSLPPNITSLFCVANGDIWVGCVPGIMKFDGYNWTYYSSSNSLLPTGEIVSVQSDSDGNTYILAKNGLVKIQDNNWEVISNYDMYTNPARSLSISANNDVYVLTTNNIQLIKNDTTITYLNPQLTDLRNSTIDESGGLWFTHSTGICEYKNNQFNVITPNNSSLPDRGYYEILEYNNVIWFAGVKDLYYPDGLYTAYQNMYSKFDISNSKIKSGVIKDIKLDPDGAVWFATGQGLTRLHADWTTFTSAGSFLPHDYVYCLAFESSGDQNWFGTHGGLALNSFSMWYGYTQANSLLPNNVVKAIDIDPNDNKYIGTGSGKFLRILEEGNIWNIFDVPGLPSINAVKFISDSVILVGTENGLYKFDGNNFSFVNMNAKSATTIYEIYKDNQNNIYVGTYSSGFYKYDGTNWQNITQYDSQLPHNTVYAFLQTDSLLWVGTAGGLVSIKDTTWTIYKTHNSGLPEDCILSLEKDSQNQLFIGTTNGLAIYNPNLQVPVELTTFTAEKNTDNTISLNWITATELNNSGFEIQRMDINSTWKTLTFIKGSGTTTTINNYSFHDKNPANTVLKYRLKQIDFDGSFEYSKIVDVDNSLVPQFFELSQNFPNPFNPNTNIKFSLPQKGLTSIKIYNILGKEIATIVNEELNAGTYQKSWDASSFVSGIYFLRINSGNFTKTIKMNLIK